MTDQLSTPAPGEFCDRHFSWLCQAGQGRCSTPAPSGGDLLRRAAAAMPTATDGAGAVVWLNAYADAMEATPGGTSAPFVGQTLTHDEADTLRAVIFRMAEDITRIKVVCTQEHPPKMGSPTREWEVGTETRHSDGTRCVLLNDGDYAILAARAAQPPTPTAVEALLARAEAGAGAWGTCSGEWLRIEDLRAALAQDKGEA
jgi:hypothetical protein